MKIAILTLRLHSNYGGILQAYALMTVLKRMGHEPMLIYNQSFKYRHGIGICAEYVDYLKRAFLKYLCGMKTLEVFKERRTRREYELLCGEQRLFIEKYLEPHTSLVYTEKDWSRLPKEYHFDAYIVGSDQVWRPAYAQPISCFFFSFLKDNPVKRLSYAASFGTDQWLFSEKETQECKQLIQQFSSVSVREESGIKLCKERLDCDAVHVLDPTMLLKAGDYECLIEKRGKRNGLLVYVLDETKEKQMWIELLMNHYRLNAFTVNQRQTATSPLPSVQSWLDGFASAQCVFTDSFHACVFSILFHVPFWVYGNESRGQARFVSLLTQFGLEDRIVASTCDLDRLCKVKAINWSKVDKKLDQLRQFSLDYLVDALSKDNY